MSFLWGADLSGTLRGAGGVGGLVAVIVHSGIQPGSYFSNYDHNGNVVALIASQSGIESARYEYGPFGEEIRATGILAKENPFCFSTKYRDDESELLYYGYRYYDASMGKWLSRDPLQERGGLLLYAFVGNNPINAIDFLGLETRWHHEYVQELRSFFSSLEVNIDTDSCGIFLSDKNHHLVHDVLRFEGKSFNEYWKSVKNEIEAALNKGDMTQAEAKKAVEAALEKLRAHPKYAFIRRTGTAIPEGLTYGVYDSMKPEKKAALYAQVWEASKSGSKLKYLGSKVATTGGKVIKIASIVMIPLQYTQGASYTAEVYHGGKYLQAAAGTAQVLLPQGPADSTATWDMSQSEVAAGNHGAGALFETFFNPTSPRWLPTQVVRGATEIILEH